MHICNAIHYRHVYLIIIVNIYIWWSWIKLPLIIISIIIIIIIITSPHFQSYQKQEQKIQHSYWNSI